MAEHEALNHSTEFRCAAHAGGQKFQISRRSRTTWIAVVTGFTIISLWPIWSMRFPAMQDYPQHLLQAQMLRVYEDPSLDYQDNFMVNLQPGSYLTFYGIVYLLSALLPIEIAGKAALSAYFLLIALLASSAAKRVGSSITSWGVLLLFPFALNQHYFYGNINYFYSLPLLFLTLLDHDRLRSGCRHGAWPVIRHFMWLIALFLTHPYTFLLYIAFAIANTVLSGREQWSLRAFVPVMFGMILFAVWFLVFHLANPSTKTTEVLRWESFDIALVYFGYMFTGMRWKGGADPVSVVFWIGIVAVLTYSGFESRKFGQRLAYRYLVYAILTTVGVFALPHVVGHYTHLGVRLAVICYFNLALFAGSVKLRRFGKALIVILLAIYMVYWGEKQCRVSREIEEVAPLVTKIPRNSSVLPLVFDYHSAEIGKFFSVHLHDHNYYHLAVGGGMNPYFFSGALFPVFYKSGSRPPAPGEFYAKNFDWEKHSKPYDYFLLRSAPQSFLADNSQHLTVEGKSGKWLLLRKKNTGG